MSHYICMISILLQHSQVRSETLIGYVSTSRVTGAQSLTGCLQGCLYAPTTLTKVGIFQTPEDILENGLVDILCPTSADKACYCNSYCNSDQLQPATSALSSCIIQDCTGMGVSDISTAIQVYTQYCSIVSAEDSMVTTVISRQS